MAYGLKASSCNPLSYVSMSFCMLIVFISYQVACEEGVILETLEIYGMLYALYMNFICILVIILQIYVLSNLLHNLSQHYISKTYIGL